MNSRNTLFPYLWAFFCMLFLSLTCYISIAKGDPSNPQPAEGDLVLPMPNGVKMVFRPVFIGEGDTPFALRKFSVGDPAGGFKENLTSVVIGGAFKAQQGGQPDWVYYIGKYEVTEAQYYAIMDPQNTSMQESTYPIRNISWFEAQEFINRYNLWLFAHAKETLPKNEDAIGYLRLPTEIEWEFAARGGSAVTPDQFDKKHPYPDALNKYEWFSGPSSSHDKVQKIGLLQPNPLKIYDMLGNVSEMTASFYQIEYYQGRVGGFVSRGGNYTTAEKHLRSSLRSELPFYGRDLTPQSSPTLGMRLVLSSIIFASRETSRVLEEAWNDYRASKVGTTSPAAVSVAPPSTQTSVQLSDAAAILDRLLSDRSLSSDAVRQLELLRASFDNIEATIKQAEIDSAYAWVEIATARSLYIFRGLKQVPVAQKAFDIAKRSGSTAIKEKLEERLDYLLKDMEEKLREYAESLRQLDRHENNSVDRAVQKYRDYLVRVGDTDRIMILNQAVTKHYTQYTQTKRIALDQWKSDLERL